jgi:DNA repair protein RecN (Recombination protein N)
LRTIYQQWKITKNEINELLGSTQNKAQEIEFLKYQLKELKALNLKKGEWQTLSRQHQQLHNAKDLLEQLNQAIELTVENETVCAAQIIQQAIHRLNEIKVDDSQLTTIRELLNTAAIHISEAGNELESYRSSFDFSCNNSEEIEARLSLIYDLSRKHHCNPEALTELQSSLAHKLETLESIDEKVSALRLHQSQLKEKYLTLAERLTKARKAAAKNLEKHITQSMQKMDIQDGEFHVQFEPLDAEPTAYGSEKINFLVQTNAGQGIQSLQKIASGGEISRISLALHVLTASTEQTPTLVFDEVDVGISGKTAATVGSLLRELGNKAQVLCITHLPQVAANGHHHYKVIKESDGKSTNTFIEKLSELERVDEIARLIGGAKITKQSRLHASELLEVPGE